MARKVETIVTLTDDLDGSKADRTVAFSFDGKNYEIDLSKRNATAFQKAIAPYLDAARRASRTSGGRAAQPRSSRTDLAAIREWANANGHPVSERGRIAQSVQDAYDSAH